MMCKKKEEDIYLLHLGAHYKVTIQKFKLLLYEEPGPKLKFYLFPLPDRPWKKALL